MKGRFITTTVLLLGVVLFSAKVSAQEVLNIDVATVIAKCKNGSLDLKRQQLQQSLAEAEISSAKEWWLPNVFVGTTFHNLDGSAMNGDGGIFREVDRQNRWYGGELNFNWDLGQGLYAVKAKKLAAESASLSNEVGQGMAIVTAISQYYEVLVADTELTIYKELIAEKSALIDQLMVQVDAGLRLESELLMAKSNLQRLRLQGVGTYQQLSQSTARMLTAMNVADVSAIKGDLKDLEMLNLVSTEELTAFDMSAHPAIQANQLMMDAKYKEAKLANKSFHFPQAGIRYSYGPFGAEYSDSDATGGLQGYVGWNIPLGQVFYNGLGKKAAVAQQLAALDMEEQTLGLNQELSQYKDQLAEIRALLDISTEGGGYAKQALDQSLLRQKEGLGSTYEVLQAQEEYIQAKLMHVRMIANYNLLQYRMLVAMGRKL